MRTDEHGSVDTSDLRARFVTTATAGPNGSQLSHVTVYMPKGCPVDCCTGPAVASKYLAKDLASGMMMQELVNAGELDTNLDPVLGIHLKACSSLFDVV